MIRLLLGFLLGLLTGKHVLRTGPAVVELRERILVGEKPAGGVAASFCEGTYLCGTSGTVFTSGTRTRMGFWGVSTCPGSSTLSDGSVWNLVPLTCDCP